MVLGNMAMSVQICPGLEVKQYFEKLISYRRFQRRRMSSGARQANTGPRACNAPLMSNNLMLASKSKYDRMASKSSRPYNWGYQDLELHVCMLSETIING